jgi:putative transposase
MRIAYQYRLRLTTEQKATLSQWLELCRRQYNYRLAERYNWWEQNRCDINACPLVCHLPELKDRPDFYSQKRDLVNTKTLFPEYKDLPSHTLQDVIARVEKTFDRWLAGDSNGKRSGRPRFKGRNRYRSIGFPDPIKPEHIRGNRIQLPKIGELKFVLHRPIPEGFKVKTAIISRYADGWYVTLSLEDVRVPEVSADIEPTWENSTGIDLGLEKFLADSEAEFEPIPQHFRKSENKLAKLQQKISTAKKGSRARKLLVRKVARLHQKIARQRKQFHFETAKKVLSKADVIFAEDLKVKNMSRRAKPKQDETGKFLPNGQSAKSGMNKSITDAGWSQFINILSFKAASAGQRVVKVDPKGTSQHCSVCLNRVPKTLSDRWHSCPCGAELDRDTNSAILIKKVGMGIASLKNARLG